MAGNKESSWHHAAVLGPSPSAFAAAGCGAGEGRWRLLCHGMPKLGAGEGEPAPSSVSRQLVSPSPLLRASGTGRRVMLAEPALGKAWRRNSSYRAPGMLPRPLWQRGGRSSKAELQGAG